VWRFLFVWPLRAGKEQGVCEATAYLVLDGAKKELLRDVVRIQRDGEELILISLLGERQMVRGKIVEADLLAHTISIEALSAGQAA